MEVQDPLPGNQSNLLGFLPLLIGMAGMIYAVATLQTSDALDLVSFIWEETSSENEADSMVGSFGNPIIIMLLSSVSIAVGFCMFDGLKMDSDHAYQRVWLKNSVFHVLLDVALVALIAWGIKYFQLLEGDEDMQDWLS